MQRRDLNKSYIIDKDLEYIFGRNVVLESLKVERKFRKLVFESTIKENYSKDPRISDIIAKAKNAKIAIEYVPKEYIRKIEVKEGFRTEGILGIVERRKEWDIKEVLAHCKKLNKEPFIIIVNNILYEENLGAILRTCAAGGVDAVVIPKRDKRSLTANVIRISMGGSEYVPLIKESLFEVIDYIKDEGIKVVAVELVGSKYYFEEDLKGPIAIVLGGEDAGVSDPILKRCDSTVKIPMLRDIQSLNVSVSTAIVIYEKIRQECQI